MQEPRNSDFLIQKFKKHKLSNHINFEGDKLKIISTQHPLGDWLYIILLIVFPTIYEIWKMYNLASEYKIENYLIFPGLPLSSLVFYFFLNQGNNNFIIDFNQNDILIFKKSFLVRFAFPKPKVISFDEIYSIEAQESAKPSNRSYKEEAQSDYKVIIRKKSRDKSIVLIEFTESETKINKELAGALLSFLKVNIFDRKADKNSN